MPVETSYPGVYVEEVSLRARSIEGVPTSTTAFVGRTARGPFDTATCVSSFAEYERVFGGLARASGVSYAIWLYFANGGGDAVVVRVGSPRGDGPPTGADLGREIEGSEEERTGIHALCDAEFQLLCLPAPPSPRAAGRSAPPVDIPLDTWRAAARLCADRGATLIVDAPADWTVARARAEAARFHELGRAAAMYFPRVRIDDPLVAGSEVDLPPGGGVLGVMARTDRERGVWTAPAGTDAVLRDAPASSAARGFARIRAEDAAALARLGVNCVRTIPAVGTVVWGARLLAAPSGADPEWKYVAVRRLGLFVERSLSRGTQWAVFEPNDEPLWARLRGSVTAFMHELFMRGAFRGATPPEGYFVRCGADTTTQGDIDRGAVNIEVGFAPVRPAEFVIIRIQQLARAGSSGDPYRTYRYRVRWHDRYVAGVSKVSCLGPSAHERSERSTNDAVTLAHGVTHDREFAEWAMRVRGAETMDEARRAAADSTSDVAIDVFDEGGALQRSNLLRHCWVSQFQGITDLDASSNAVAITYLRLEHDP